MFPKIHKNMLKAMANIYKFMIIAIFDWLIRKSSKMVNFLYMSCLYFYDYVKYFLA